MNDDQEPPGAYLADELAARDMSQAEFARRIGRPYQAINEIIHGKKAITADTALDIADELGTSAELWHQLQASYDLAQARRRKAQRLADGG